MFRKYKAIMDKYFLKDKKVFTVHEEDYLKVVNEKGILEKVIEFTDVTNINLRKELKRKDEEIIKLKKDFKLLQAISKDAIKRLKEKDEEIEKLKEQLYNTQIESIANFLIRTGLSESGKKISDCAIDVIKKLIKEKQILQDKLEEAELLNLDEELWTLKYIYNKDGITKEYEQNGMIKEDAEELIGMDSDNWNHYSLTKEERPDKDKVIEGLIIRSESGEEVIKELERELEKTNKKYKKYYELYNDTQRVGPKDLRA